METVSIFMSFVLCASLLVATRVEKEIINSQSPTHQIVRCASIPGIYCIEPHPVFGALYDLLYVWECKTKTTVILIDQMSGLSKPLIEHLMKKNSLTDCDIDIISVGDEDIKTNVNTIRRCCHLISNYRYIIIVGRDNIIEHILTTEANCTEKSSGYTTWIIVASDVPIFLRSNEYANYGDPLKSQMTIMIPQTPQQDELRQNKFATNIYIYDVFRSYATNKLEHIMFAHWSPLKGLSFTYNILSDYKKLRGRIVRLTTTKVYPYSVLDENNNIIDGILHDPYITLGRYFKAKLRLVSTESHLKINPKYYRHILIPPKDFNFGIDINGSLTGMYGVMQRGEADISLSISAMRDFRLKAAYYGTKICNGYLQMVMPRPSTAIPPTVYILSFGKFVWLTIGGCLVVALTILALAITVSPHNEALVSTIRSSKKLLYWLFSGQFLQIAFDNPPGWAIKWTYYVILTATMTVFIYYTSIFTSFLTYREMKLPFETFGELADNMDYQILVAEASSMRTTIEQSNDDEFKKVWKRIALGGKKSLMPSFEAGYEKVLTGKYVFIGDGPTTQALAKGSCDTIFPKTTYMKESYYMTFRKDFPYAKVYANRFLRQKETGVINRWERIFKPEADTSCDENLDFQTFNLHHVFTLFIGLSMGVTASLITMIIENYFCK